MDRHLEAGAEAVETEALHPVRFRPDSFPTGGDVRPDGGVRPEGGSRAAELSRGPSLSRAGAEGAVPRGESGPLRVVVADDADGVRDLICLLLDLEPDFTIVGRAANGAEAIDLVAETGPDLVILDVAMPVLDGIAALPEVRRLVPGARVVVFTGFSAHTVRDEALALGADDVMEKGLGSGPLVDRLRAVCRRPAPAA
ncbi:MULTISPECIES: response regulator transcription factor [unclassified Pseudofrankia]|uniref:response regulator transcription factor n=1 Tax=unclassified Pseudofrankia TaxID=2994372 RepID=UPI000A529C46|nr:MULTISPECIES: response regulator transcription factor [unclassified Pseudofrankia]MDT3438613.1 response regulator transcription factor [Pseudofrankia sp. BMG5.37]